MSDLQKAPSGLLELLRLRSNGDQPTTFADSVLSVVVANEHYGADLQFSSSDSGTGAIGQSIQVVIGSGFTAPATPGPVRFMAIGGDMVFGAAAGTWLQMRIGIRAPTANSPPAWIAWQSYAAPFLVAAGALTIVANFPAPIILLPGSAVRIEMTGDAVGADHTLRLRTLRQELNPGN